MALLKVPLSVPQKLLNHSVNPAVLQTPRALARQLTTPCGSFIWKSYIAMKHSSGWHIAFKK